MTASSTPTNEPGLQRVVATAAPRGVETQPRTAYRALSSVIAHDSPLHPVLPCSLSVSLAPPWWYRWQETKHAAGRLTTEPLNCSGNGLINSIHGQRSRQTDGRTEERTHAGTHRSTEAEQRTLCMLGRPDNEIDWTPNITTCQYAMSAVHQVHLSDLISAYATLFHELSISLPLYEAQTPLLRFLVDNKSTTSWHSATDDLPLNHDVTNYVVCLFLQPDRRVVSRYGIDNTYREQPCQWGTIRPKHIHPHYVVVSYSIRIVQHTNWNFLELAIKQCGHNKGLSGILQFETAFRIAVKTLWFFYRKCLFRV